MLRWLFLFCTIVSLVSCFPREEKAADSLVSPAPNSTKKMTPVGAPSKDRNLDIFVRYFEQADAIHREAWWVLTNERRTVGRSPFGKVQRAILSSQNIKLANKSLFRCDRYLVKRDIMGIQGYPQRLEIFEKCSEKLAAKKLAELAIPHIKEIQVTFFSENMEEVLGLGATVLNKRIQCTLTGTELGQLLTLKCKDWAQDRSKEQMILLTVYDYEKAGRNLIKLRGKVYENLTDIRKIEADVPLEGKIYVTETELYAPEPTPVPTPKASPSPAVKAPVAPNAPPMILPPENEMVPPQEPPAITPLHLPPPREVEVVDPDVLMQRQQEEQQAPHSQEGEVPLEQSEQIPAGGVRGR